jgi:hypothetical protein
MTAAIMLFGDCFLHRFLNGFVMENGSKNGASRHVADDPFGDLFAIRLIYVDLY